MLRFQRIAWVLPSLAMLVPVPTRGDTYTFDLSSQMSMTFGTVPGVSYSFTNQSGPAFTTYLNAIAGLKYDTSRTSVAFNGGVLSITLAPVSGWTTTPPFGSKYFSLALAHQGGSVDVGIANANNYAVRVPITDSLTWMGSGTRGRWGDGDSYAESEVFLDSRPYDFLVATSCDIWDGCRAWQNTGLDDHRLLTMPVVETAWFTVPANSVQLMDANYEERGEAVANAITPEPGTLILLGSGVTMLVFLFRTRST